MKTSFGIFTPFVRRWENTYIGSKVELVIEEIPSDNIFYYSAVMRITQGNTRIYVVGNTRHLGNTPLNTRKTLRDMMMSRFVANIYTMHFPVTNAIPIICKNGGSLKPPKASDEKPMEESDEELAEMSDEEPMEVSDWATFWIDPETENVDDCILYKREDWEERNLHAKLDQELEEYFIRGRYNLF